MREFKKYQHIEHNLNDKNVKGLLDGNYIIQPKLDGANCQLYLDKEELIITSRNHILNNTSGCRHMYLTMNKHKDKYIRLLNNYPNIKIVGEYLVSNKIKYDKYDKFIVFDLIDLDAKNENGKTVYIDWIHAVDILKSYEIDHVPYLKFSDINILNLNTPFIEYKDFCNFMVKNASELEKCEGEGFVIKNYNYKNYEGSQRWCKVINKDFYYMKQPKIEIDNTLELKFIQENMTGHLLDKCHNSLLKSSTLKDFIILCQKEFAEDYNVCDIPELNVKILNNLVAQYAIQFFKEFDKEKLYEKN